VTKPDGEVVSFKYDSLGHRVEKSSDSKAIKFVWDGNNPLHEWEETKLKDSLTTWIFDEGAFTPSAKLMNQGNYSIITDHLETPVEAYDEVGKKVWEQELDIYGRVKPRPIVKNMVKLWMMACLMNILYRFVIKGNMQMRKQDYITTDLGIMIRN